MKESMWGYLLLILGIAIITILMIVQNTTTTSEEDYYLSKEIMEASMLDSVDYGLYAATGEIRIIREKFVETYIRRFAESVNNNKTYTLEFYEIYESPPKASVRVKTSTGTYNVGGTGDTSFTVLTQLSGILETAYTKEQLDQANLK